MHFTSFANVFQNCTGEQPKIHAWRLFNCLNFHHLFKKLSAMLKSVPKSLIFFHKKKKYRVFPQKSTKAILARKFNVWFSEIEIFSPAKNLQLQFRRENSNTWFPIFHKNLQLQFWLILTHKFKCVRFLILANFGTKIQIRDFSNILIFKSKLLLSQCHIFVLNFLHTVVVKSPCLSLAL